MLFEAHDGTQIFFTDSGTGKPLVLIHGWPLSSAMWEYQVNELAERGIRCVAYDRRGFGRSDQPYSGYDYDTLASDLKALIEHLKLQDVTLAGFSMGGGEVARYMRKFRGSNVSRTVFISSVTPFLLKTADNPDGVEAGVSEQMAIDLRVDRPAFLTEFAKTFFGVGWMTSPISDAMLAANCEDAMRGSPRATLACAKAFFETDFRDDLPSISVPALVIHGDSDQTVPIDASARRTAQLIKSAQLKIYEGAPHGLFYTERARLNADLEEFVLGASVSRTAA
ncbi:MAG TPA: alpha/beta hydrolase [Bryobacteraceae bacterium]|nr:alpha/beta hydrolase [Bryobacteraceae bacterium]